MNRRQFGRLGLMGALASAVKPANATAKHAQRQANETARPFDPSVMSIQRHISPEWFDDAKFGMFIDFGLYSVAGYAPRKEKGAIYPDWYLLNMYNDPATVKYHQETWGANFQRDDFIPLFKANNFDPEFLSQTAADAGMRYVVPVCKHHDGFCLWPSSYTRRNALAMGPKRDLIGPLKEACRKRNLKFGFYFSLEEWEYPILENGKEVVRVWGQSSWAPYQRATHEIVPYDPKVIDKRITGKIPVKDFFGDYIIPQAKEFIDLYDPDILWFDGDWDTDIRETRSPEIVSYFYNKAAGRKLVAANDRMGAGTRSDLGDFFCSEYGSISDLQQRLVHKWEENRGISQSFGYNWQDTDTNVLTLPDFIEMLTRIVSEGGNLLLIVNLDGTGKMPDYILARLSDVGKWLKMNGEAIYGTRPWIVASQMDGTRFTQSKDRRYLYAIHKGWPGNGTVTIEHLILNYPARIRLLGADQDLKWTRKDCTGRVVIEVPQALRLAVDTNAIVLRIELTD